MLHIHCLKRWLNLSGPAMEEELHERSLFRRVAAFDEAVRMPDEIIIQRFRHLLEKHQLLAQVQTVVNTGLAQQGLMLKIGILVDAAIFAAPSSTKNKEGERDPEMHKTKKGNQWHRGQEGAHWSGCSIRLGTRRHRRSRQRQRRETQAAKFLHGKKEHAQGAVGYQAVDKCNALDPNRELHKLLEQAERFKADVRAEVEHPSE